MGSHPTSATKRRRPLKKSLSPRLAKLEDDFVKSGGKWKEYRVHEIFDIKNTLSFNKDMLTEGDGYDYITRTSQNQGILQTTGFVNSDNINEAGTWSLGLLQMDFFYRNKPWYAGQFVRKIVPKQVLSRYAILYFTTLLNKLKPTLLSGLVRDVDSTFLSSTFFLPTKNKAIDFSYIEKYIKALEAERIETLEAERIETLEAYLKVTGLRDYHLTKNDEEILDKFAKLSDTQSRVEKWSYCVLRDLFDKVTTKYYGSINKFNAVSTEQNEEYSIPVVYAKYGDNGIMYWAKRGDFETQENILSIIYNGAIAAGLVYAQPRPTGILAESYFIKSKNKDTSFETNLFFKTVIQKSIYPKYSREYLATWTGKVEHEVIAVPTMNDNIDYQFMTDFIKVIKKLVIKDLLEWTDMKINATKEVVAND